MSKTTDSHPWTICETTYTHWAGHEARIIRIFDNRGFEVASLPLGLSRSDEEQRAAARLIVDAKLVSHGSLARELTYEKDKIECPTCKGRGRLVVSFGPNGDGEMNCWQCRGEGRLDGSLPPLTLRTTGT